MCSPRSRRMTAARRRFRLPDLSAPRSIDATILGDEGEAVRDCAGGGSRRAPAPCGWRPTLSRPARPSPARSSRCVVGVSLLGCGLASWSSRPENRIGPIMVLTALCLVRRAAERGIDAVDVHDRHGRPVRLGIGLLYLLLSFPSGRLPGRIDRWLVGPASCWRSVCSSWRCCTATGPGCAARAVADNLLQVVHDNHTGASAGWASSACWASCWS